MSVEYEVTAVSGDVTVSYVVPQAEYMYGCSATSVGMLLGYYDLYGYTDEDGQWHDMSRLIPGTITVDSRHNGDGNIYDMKNDSVLCRFIASTSYVAHFYEKTPEQEKKWSFINANPALGLNIPAWNCIADYLGTGQYWRGNDDLSTTTYYASLADIIKSEATFTVDSEKIPVKYGDLKYGLDLLMTDRALKTPGVSVLAVKPQGKAP